MPSGTVKLFKSMQAYEFNPSGMTRGGDAPLAAGAVAMQQSYKISEHDVAVVRTLGQGCSGLVQKVFIPRESRFAAVKKISVLEREKRHQLMNDIKALCNAPNVPGLIRFYGAYHSADKGQIAVVLEYMDGGSLADVLSRVGKIPEGVISGIAARILPALDFMHSHHMVHRDIKPANILMSTDGEPKISDFGISAFIDNTIAQCNTFLGTVTYMSPERIDGKPYSFPADIWAIGLTLLECITGRYPYDASSGTMELMLHLLQEECPLPSEDEMHLSSECRDFIQRCMAKDPMARPTASELLRHPFIVRSVQQPVDLRKFMKCMYSRKEKISDAVSIATARFYNNLAWNWKDSDSIAAFYASNAQLTCEGGKYRGRFTIASQFHSLMKQFAYCSSSVAFHVEECNHQMLNSSEDTVLIQAKVVMLDETPQSVDEGAQRLAIFSDTFIMNVLTLENAMPGTGYVFASQIFRWVVAPQPSKKRGGDSQKCRVQ